MQTGYVASLAHVSLRAVLIHPHHKGTVYGRTVELGINRAVLLVSAPLPVDLPFKLFLEIPNLKTVGNRTVEINGIVQYSVLVANINQYRLGVRFETLSPTAHEAVQGLLSSP